MAIPPQILAQYETATSRANQVANTPFTPYSGEFVAPVNAEQYSGISNTNVAANEAQPYFGAAKTGLGTAQAATNPINAAAESGTAASSAPLTGQQIDSYLSPYLNEVLGSTSQLLNQNNQQQQAGQLGDAIRSGAFGGDRTGIAAANLEQQQNLANANIYSGIANQGYQSALSTAQGQQQIGLAGAKQLADIGSTAYGEGANTASEMAGLGAGAQTAGLQGAQAQIGAGTVQQQTQQAQDTAQYQQFLQQQSYPFQVAQFLANVSEGVGALSGSTTTTTQPGGFFSDERLKEDMEVIGKTFDGQPIYRYKMRGDPREQIGLSAQQVEKRHPEAVGLAGGFKFVDYGRATEEAANRAHFYEGGVVPFRRPRYADGGSPYSGGLDAVLEAQRQMYSSTKGGLAGAAVPGGGSGRVPEISTGTTRSLGVAPNLQARPTPMQNMNSAIDTTNNAVGLGRTAAGLYRNYQNAHPAGPDTRVLDQQSQQATQDVINQTRPSLISPDTSTAGLAGANTDTTSDDFYRGGLARGKFDTGGTPYRRDSDLTELNIPDENAHNQLAKAPNLPKPAPSGFQQLMSGMGGMGGMSNMGSMFSSGSDPSSGIDASQSSDFLDIAANDVARGGFIRKKRDAGGDVIDAASANRNAGVDTDAPDATVDVAPALQKSAPNQSLVPIEHLALAAGEAYIGDYAGAAGQLYDAYSSYKGSARGGLVGGRKRSQALARGGLAGRRGYDDGGATDDDSDATSAPSSAPAASTNTTDQATGVAPPADAPWWKKSENIIPILSGLAAMGTAPTVHPGVALAAGLGAGADSYLKTRSSQAKTAEVQQRAKGLEIANRLNTATTQAAIDAISGKGPYSQPQTQWNAPQGAPRIDPNASKAAIDQDVRNSYQVPPITPQESDYLNRMSTLSASTKNPAWQQKAETAIAARVKAQTFANQQAAQHEAAALQAVMNDPSQSEIVRKAAEARYNAVSQPEWTGAKIEDIGGSLRNSLTGAPTAGAQAQTLTPIQLWEQWKTLAAPVDTGAPARIPFQQFAAQHGVNVPADWSPTAPAASAPPARSVMAPSRPSTTSAPPAPPAQDFSDAPAKPAWLNDPNHITTPAQEPLAKEYGDKENELKAEANQLPNTQRELIKAQRVLSLLPNAKTGPGTDTMSAVQTALGNMTGSQFVSWLNSNPSAHALLQKQLGTNALESTLKNLRESGASVKLGQQESALIINRLSASTEMPKDAIKSLMQWQIQEGGYELGRQKAIPAYLAQGKDPTLFDNYYSTKRPMQNTLTTAAPAGTTLPHWQIVPPKAITGKADYDALPSGAVYTWQGRRGVKP